MTQLPDSPLKFALLLSWTKVVYFARHVALIIMNRVQMKENKPVIYSSCETMHLLLSKYILIAGRYINHNGRIILSCVREHYIIIVNIFVKFGFKESFSCCKIHLISRE